jgi:positive regulator of sigma E activity
VPRVSAAGQAPLLPGERVRVGVDRQALTRATLVAYALPLAALICGAVMARSAGDTWAVVAALASLLGGVVLARRLLRRWQDALAPVVLGRAQPGAASATAAGDAFGCRSAASPAAAPHSAPAFIPCHIQRRP